MSNIFEIYLSDSNTNFSFVFYVGCSFLYNDCLRCVD